MVNVIVIAASAGGLKPLLRVIAALPVPCSAAIFVVMHIGPNPSQLPWLLMRRGPHLARFAADGDPIKAGRIFVAPPDRHMTVGRDRIWLDHGPRINHTRPAADPLFLSAAMTHGKRVMGIVLSGYDGDGAAGLRAIKEHGGIALVQAPEEAEVPSMPRAAIAADHPDGCLPIAEIARNVSLFCADGGR